MDFYHDPDHTDMASAVRELLSREFPAETLRSTSSFGSLRKGLWNALAEQGLQAIIPSEEHGGLDLGWSAATLILQEIGRAALPGPFVDTVCVAPELLRAVGGSDAGSLLKGIADGSTTVGVADRSGLVTCLDTLDVVLVPRGDSFAAMRADAALFDEVPTLDTVMPLSRYRGSGDAAVLFEVRPSADRLARALNAGALATAAQLLGVARQIIDLTRSYVAQREQFGRVIGSFQAVQHALVDASLQSVYAEPVVHAAAWALDKRDEAADLAVAHAKVAAVRACRIASRTGLQLHGAIGYTYEYDLQHWLKRTMTMTALYGTESEHRATIRKFVLDDSTRRIALNMNVPLARVGAGTGANG